MHYRICSESKAGSNHEEHKEESQDAFFGICSDRKFALAAADGAGNCRFAGKGARLVSKAAAEFLFSEMGYLMDVTPDCLKAKIMNCVGSTLTRAMQSEQSSFVTDFGSTLLFAASDGKRFLIGHLGDGAILGVSGGNVSVISFPENGRSDRETFLTTSLKAEKHLRTYRGELDMYDRFILMTDGLVPCVFNDGYVLNRSYGSGLGIEEILSRAVNSRHSDDAGYITADWRCDKNG